MMQMHANISILSSSSQLYTCAILNASKIKLTKICLFCEHIEERPLYAVLCCCGANYFFCCVTLYFTIRMLHFFIRDIVPAEQSTSHMHLCRSIRTYFHTTYYCTVDIC